MWNCVQNVPLGYMRTTVHQYATYHRSVMFDGVAHRVKIRVDGQQLNCTAINCLALGKPVNVFDSV